MTPHGFKNLGGQQKLPDPRDLKLGSAAPSAYSYPPVLTNSAAFSAPVEYQAQQPACGAHAGASMRGVVSYCHYTPRFTWADIKSFDGMPLDWGTDIRSILKSITKEGALDFPLLGNDSSLSFSSYAQPAITTAMKQNASKKAGDGYGFIQDKTFDGIKQFLSDHGPSIMLMRVGQEMWTASNGQNSWAENDILPLRPPAKIVSGHFVLIHSYDEKYIYFLNSWSDQWGRKGHGYFDASYMPYVNDVGTIFPLDFTHDLQQGMTDGDVQSLQRILNKNPQTQVAVSGPGSPGQETTYFGGLTFTAVKKYQTLNHINPTGYVGPLTRATLNNV